MLSARSSRLSLLDIQYFDTTWLRKTYLLSPSERRASVCNLMIVCNLYMDDERLIYNIFSHQQDILNYEKTKI